MSYQIGEDETLGESIRRAACEQITAAIAASRIARNGEGSPVLETRKHLKKARATLRLLRSEVGHERFRREDRRLRNVGRLISEIRDAEVRLETVKQLGRGPSPLRGSSYRETEELLTFELDSFLAAFAGWPEEAARRLERAQNGIAHWPLHHLTGAQVCRTVRKSYRKGRQALARVRKKESTPRFHELRKRAKELWYQMRLLRPLQPAVFHEMSGDLKALGQHLGHAHDLCFVSERLRSLAAAGARDRGHRALQALLDSREKDLWRTALALAERFYALKPKEFASRIAAYFEEREDARMRELRQLAPI